MLVMFVSILGYVISMLFCICRLEMDLHLDPFLRDTRIELESVPCVLDMDGLCSKDLVGHKCVKRHTSLIYFPITVLK